MIHLSILASLVIKHSNQIGIFIVETYKNLELVSTKTSIKYLNTAQLEHFILKCTELGWGDKEN